MSLPGGGAVGRARRDRDQRLGRSAGGGGRATAHHHLVDPATGLRRDRPGRPSPRRAPHAWPPTSPLEPGSSPARRARPARPVGDPGAVRRTGTETIVVNRGVGRDGRGAGVHLTSSPIDWYAARAAGIVAYLLLTAVVTLGVAMAGRAPGRRWKRWPMFAVEDVHRAGGLLVGTFIALHVATIAIDRSCRSRSWQLAIPLTSHYRPMWTALGHRRRRAPARARGDEPLPRPHPAPVVAAGALRQLRRLGRGDAARPRQRHRPERPVDGRDVRGLGGGRRGGGHAGGSASGAGSPPRFGRRRSPAPAAAAAVVVGRPRTWPAASVHPRPGMRQRFTDRLSGRILQQEAATRAIVSMSGTATGDAERARAGRPARRRLAAQSRRASSSSSCRAATSARAR